MKISLTVLGMLSGVVFGTGPAAFAQYGPQGVPVPNAAYGFPAGAVVAPMGYPTAWPGQALGVMAVDPQLMGPVVGARAAAPGVPGGSAIHVTVGEPGMAPPVNGALAPPPPPLPPLEGYSPSCTSGCTPGCTTKGCGQKDCGTCCGFTFRIFGDYLYLRARDAEVSYAVETNSNLAPGSRPDVPVQTSRIGIVDPDASSGFRVGFGVCLDACSEVVVTYTTYEVGTSDLLTRGNANVRQITSLVAHPSTLDAIGGTVQAGAHLYLDFDLIDADYRHTFLQDDCTDLSWLIGVRYGESAQRFTSRMTDNLNSSISDGNWATGIDYYGAGIRLGLEGEKYHCRTRTLCYAKGYASLLAGEFEATYVQTVQNDSTAGVDTSWKAGRVVPIFDLEVGAGFYGPKGRFRATVGYVFSSWTNLVKTQDFIHAVQTNDFANMSGTTTFDGLVARIEGRF